MSPPSTNGVVAWCLELHDLWLSKAIAGRPKDLVFCRGLARKRLVDPEVLRERVQSIAGSADSVVAAVSTLIDEVSGDG